MAETGRRRLDYPSFRRKIPRAAAVSQVALWSKAGSVWIKADDETHQIIGTLDKIRDALEPIIPASLGWEVITPAENNDGFLVSVYCGTVLRQPTALIQAAKDSSPTLALATRS